MSKRKFDWQSAAPLLIYIGGLAIGAVMMLIMILFGWLNK